MYFFKVYVISLQYFLMSVPPIMLSTAVIANYFLFHYYCLFAITSKMIACSLLSGKFYNLYPIFVKCHTIFRDQLKRSKLCNIKLY